MRSTVAEEPSISMKSQDKTVEDVSMDFGGIQKASNQDDSSRNIT